MEEKVKREIPPKSSFLNEFLWSCAGVDKTIIRHCPTDFAKYAGSGGTILFTSLMAMLSGGYAMFFVFDSKFTAVLFGIFWGLLIFNLDRYIVNTMYSDGKPTISWGELRSGLPRIIMAIFLGIVISTPLEMKIFEDRINSQLTKDNIMRANETRDEANKGNEKLIERRDILEAQLRGIDARLSAANEELKKEAEGSALSGKEGHGPIYRDKEKLKNTIEQEKKDWESRNLKELESVKKQLQAHQESSDAEIDNGLKENGFCVRYEAFSNVKKDNFSLQLVSIFIMLLFIIIETAPTFFKMMMTSGPYDDMLRLKMHEARVSSDKSISDINDEINTQIQITTEQNRRRLEAEVLANKEVMERISLAQAEIIQVAIDTWREEELKKVAENPSEYIKTRQPQQKN